MERGLVLWRMRTTAVVLGRAVQLLMLAVFSLISDAAGVGAGDAAGGAGGGNAAYWLPKTNSSIALPSGLRFLVLILTLP
jgi:hypothetical protein